MNSTTVKICSINDCEEKAKARTLCNAHYLRSYRNLDMTAPLKNKGLTGCSVENCDRNHYSKSLCSKHYRQTVNGVKLT